MMGESEDVSVQRANVPAALRVYGATRSSDINSTLPLPFHHGRILVPDHQALHIIFMVTFFAGTFYIVRLFIYHKEADGLNRTARSSRGN